MKNKKGNHIRGGIAEEAYRSLDFSVAILLLLRKVRVIAVVIGETSLAVQVSGEILGCKPPPGQEIPWVRSTRWFIDSVIALLLIIGAITLMGTLFFNRRLVFLVGGPIFEMSQTKLGYELQFPNAPGAFRQGFIEPLLQLFYRQHAGG